MHKPETEDKDWDDPTFCGSTISDTLTNERTAHPFLGVGKPVSTEDPTSTTLSLLFVKHKNVSESNKYMNVKVSVFTSSTSSEL